MHLFLNITKDVMGLIMGDNIHLRRLETEQDDFVLGSSACKQIDAELQEAAIGICLSAFGPKPRTLPLTRVGRLPNANISCCTFVSFL